MASTSSAELDLALAPTTAGLKTPAPAKAAVKTPAKAPAKPAVKTPAPAKPAPSGKTAPAQLLTQQLIKTAAPVKPLGAPATAALPLGKSTAPSPLSKAAITLPTASDIKAGLVTSADVADEPALPPSAPATESQGKKLGLVAAAAGLGILWFLLHRR
jgi:hypothetical protein